MIWLWIGTSILLLFSFTIVFLILSAHRLHPRTILEDEDQMEAIRLCNEKHQRKLMAKKKTK